MHSDLLRTEYKGDDIEIGRPDLFTRNWKSPSGCVPSYMRGFRNRLRFICFFFRSFGSVFF